MIDPDRVISNQRTGTCIVVIRRIRAGSVSCSPARRRTMDEIQRIRLRGTQQATQRGAVRLRAGCGRHVRTVSR